MITTQQQQPAPRVRAANVPSPPAWLKLEKGEELLASYSGKQVAEVVICTVLAVLSLCCIIALLMLVFGKAGKDVAGILMSVGGTASGLVITLGQLRKTQLHVTNKMLIFTEGKKGAGVPLSEVSAIRRGDGSRWTIGIYVRGAEKPAGKITILDTERVTAELIEFCQRGGARLAAERTDQGRGKLTK